MREETKQTIHIQMDLLAKTLKESNTVIGIMVDKSDFDKSKLVFLDFDSFKAGNPKDGFSISLVEMNKELLGLSDQ